MVILSGMQSEKYLATSVEEFCRDVERDFSKERVCLCSGALSFTGQSNPFQTWWPGRQNGTGCGCLTEKQSGAVHWKGIIYPTSKKEFRHSTVWSDRHLCRPPQTLWKEFFLETIWWEWFLSCTLPARCKCGEVKNPSRDHGLGGYLHANYYTVDVINPFGGLTLP